MTARVVTAMGLAPKRHHAVEVVRVVDQTWRESGGLSVSTREKYPRCIVIDNLRIWSAVRVEPLRSVKLLIDKVLTFDEIDSYCVTSRGDEVALSTNRFVVHLNGKSKAIDPR